MRYVRTLSAIVALATGLAIPAAVLADATLKEAEHAVAEMVAADPGQKTFLDHAAGYAIFPNVAKGALIVGGAGGSGYVFEKGKPVGTTTLSQVTVGAQIGGQAYYEIIYFENAATLAAFKKGEWTMAAQVSAVALSAGASADAGYKDGVAVFTLTQGGAMAEASIGGQKFTYTPLAKKS